MHVCRLAFNVWETRVQLNWSLLLALDRFSYTCGVPTDLQNNRNIFSIIIIK